jgi:hypothetical protein
MRELAAEKPTPAAVKAALDFYRPVKAPAAVRVISRKNHGSESRCDPNAS